ncbi:MAG: bifunctional phosphoglucose/phosphomannose isomerase [Candidatus Hodarchaeales archaeon]|jgi:glucose/mannose-6-phosphate isomerase
MDIDDLQKISGLDTDDMLGMVFTWPSLIEKIMDQSIDIPSEISIGTTLISYKNDISHILICGMGGSAVSGDYISTYYANSLDIPIIVQRNYALPKFASGNTLVIAISYSGNTEETISGMSSAIKNKCPIICVGSGGKMENFCISNKIPYFKIPAGNQPRASFPLLLFPILKILDSMNIINLEDDVIQEVIQNLKELRELIRPQTQASENQAKQIAKKLQNRIPVIWSPFFCVANRLKCQINENSKQLAIAEELPELNHNHIVGFQSLAKNNPFIVIVFRFPLEHANVSLRFEISKEIIKPKVEILEIQVVSGNLLTQMVTATYLGDYISIYLALLNDQNPNTVDSIDFLKEQMETRGKTQSSLMKKLDKLSFS